MLFEVKKDLWLKLVGGIRNIELDEKMRADILVAELFTEKLFVGNLSFD